MEVRRIPASIAVVELEPLNASRNEQQQSSRERVGQIYRLSPDHLAFVCAHCGEEFPLLIQFTAHIQSHLIQIHSDYIEPIKESLSDEYDDVFDDGGVCNESDSGRDHQMDDDTDDRPIVMELTEAMHEKFENKSIDAADNVMPHNENSGTDTKSSSGPFASSINKDRAENMHAPAKKFQCDECGRNFQLPYLLRSHMISHEKVGQFKCDQCPNTYKYPISLSRHKLRHGSERSHKCHLCDKSYYQKNQLKHHQSIHHAPEVEALCDICNKSYSNMHKLRLHMRQHSVQNRLKCPLCSFTCLFQSHLADHKRSHSDEREFQCDICPAAFKRKTKLLAHRRSHAIASGSSEMEQPAMKEKFENKSIDADVNDLPHNESSGTGTKSSAGPFASSDYIEPIKESLSNECDDIFDDGGVCNEADSGGDHQMDDDNDDRPIVIEITEAMQEKFEDKSIHADVNDLPHNKTSGTGTESSAGPFASSIKRNRHVDASKLKPRKQKPAKRRRSQPLAALLALAAKPLETVRYRCNICKRKFDDKTAKIEHMLSHAKKFQCEECGRQFQTPHQLRSHMISHEREGQYKCDQCPKTYKYAGSLSIHKLRHGSERPHKCHLCDKSFYQRKQLKRHHSINHGPEVEALCDICNKSYSNVYKLRVHMRQHSMHNLLKCPVCNFSSPFQSQLDEHKRSHSDEREFECDICPSAFKRKNSLLAHRRAHAIASGSGEMEQPANFTCSICNQHYTTAGALRNHMHEHTGRISLQCDQCEFRCHVQSKLDRHVISHSDQRNFRCDSCPKAFKREDALMTHKIIHLGDLRSFKCKWCDKKFKTKRCFGIHTLSKHGRRWDDDVVGGESATPEG